MNIALILPGFSAHPADWAIPALQHLARTLAQTHHVTVFSQRYPAAGTYHFDNLTHHALGGGQRFGLASLKIWLNTAHAVIARHRATPFDLLHAFWADEAGFAAVLAGQVIRRPVIVSVGGGELTRLPDIAYGAQRFLARRLTTRLALTLADAVTAGSRYQRAMTLAHGVPAPKLHLAPLGVDTGRFRPAVAPPPTPVIIQAASLLPVKDQALLLRVVAQVHHARPAVQLHLVGHGPRQDDLRQLAHQLDLSHNIRWFGQIAYPSMPARFQAATLYLQSSRHESQGLAVLEALACGLPVLGTPVGILPEVGQVSENVGALAGWMVGWLDSPTRYAQASQAARALAEEKYSLSVTTAAFEELYRRVKGEG